MGARYVGRENTRIVNGMADRTGCVQPARDPVIICWKVQVEADGLSLWYGLRSAITLAGTTFRDSSGEDFRELPISRGQKTRKKETSS